MNLRSRALEQGLTDQEYDRIVSLLGREPNEVELGIIAVMWSEHCSYKTTKKYLKTLPTTGPQMLLGPGENAGVIKLGSETAVAFKVESHNHPSFIEPFQGAATGVGGILRDVFTMGARPVALLDSLHFGEETHPKTPFLFHGVVSGISHYGNCMGIPNVGGETHFDACYNGNILVNAMAVGVCKTDQIYLANASGIGNKVLYLGSKTGKDGIHGATMASEEFSEGSEEKRPTVQVGDPFTEKLLMEATLEMLSKGLVEGIQDMGAAGIACSTFEMASKGQTGMEVNLDLVPLREKDTSAFEMFLSESQERMLLVTTPDRIENVKDVAKHWGVDCVEIGVVTDTQKVIAYHRGEKVVDLPVEIVVSGAQELDRPFEKPIAYSQMLPVDKIDVNLKEALNQYIKSFSSADKSFVFGQYDHTVGSDTLLKPGADAAIIRIKDCEQNIAVSLDSRHDLCQADPYHGTCHAFAESYRNLSAVGAKALAMTNCLNFGNPEDKLVMGQIIESIRGINDSALALGTPVTGGNVSLYNQTNNQNIDPTPTIGMVGSVAHSQVIRPYFLQSGQLISRLGNPWGNSLFACDFAKQFYPDQKLKVCEVDFKQEIALQEMMIELYQNNWISFGRDISKGGLFQVLIESIRHPESLGAAIQIPDAENPWGFLFGEPSANMMIVHDKEYLNTIEDFAKSKGMAFKSIGEIGSNQLSVGSVWSAPVDDLRKVSKELLKGL